MILEKIDGIFIKPITSNMMFAQFFATLHLWFTLAIRFIGRSVRHIQGIYPLFLCAITVFREPGVNVRIIFLFACGEIRYLSGNRIVFEVFFSLWRQTLKANNKLVPQRTLR